MIENTLENKRLFFVMYFGQSLYTKESYEGEGGLKAVDTYHLGINYPDMLDEGHLVLRPLNLLTDEDAKMIASIENIGKISNIIRGTGRTKVGNRKKDFRSIQTIDQLYHIYLEEDQIFIETDDFEDYNRSHISLQSYQYLISKGYAVSYMDADVKTLVEWGWIKLLDYNKAII